MNGQAKEIEQWIIKGDHDLGTAKIMIVKNVRDLVMLKMDLKIDYNDVIDK